MGSKLDTFLYKHYPYIGAQAGFAGHVRNAEPFFAGQRPWEERREMAVATRQCNEGGRRQRNAHWEWKRSSRRPRNRSIGNPKSQLKIADSSKLTKTLQSTAPKKSLVK